MRTTAFIICGLFLLCLLGCGSKRVAQPTVFFQFLLINKEENRKKV